MASPRQCLRALKERSTTLTVAAAVGTGVVGDGSPAARAVPVLDAIWVCPGLAPGRPRTRPDSVLADKAYSSRAIRAELRRRGIVAVIPEPRDQRGQRKRARGIDSERSIQGLAHAVRECDGG